MWSNLSDTVDLWVLWPTMTPVGGEIALLCSILGAVIDHIQAYSRGGAAAESNFVTACNKCNMRKSAIPAEEFSTRSPLRPVKGKYGEPAQWDGLSTLFMVLMKQALSSASPTERDWLRALESRNRGATRQRDRSASNPKSKAL
jgi:hypothetical protein